MDMQTRKLTVVREDRYAEPVISGEKVVEGQGGGDEKDSPMSAGWPKVSGVSQAQQRTESPSRRLGSFSQLPNLAGRGVGQGYSQVGGMLECTLSTCSVTDAGSWPWTVIPGGVMNIERL
jgi:hypothetical protein